MGLGVVGTKILTNLDFLILLSISPFTELVTNAMTHMSFLGYSTKTTSLKLLELVDITVSIICFIDEYTVLITGVLNKTISPSLSKFLPIKPGVIAPIRVITKITIIKPKPGI